MLFRFSSDGAISAESLCGRGYGGQRRRWRGGKTRPAWGVRARSIICLSSRSDERMVEQEIHAERAYSQSCTIPLTWPRPMKARFWLSPHSSLGVNSPNRKEQHDCMSERKNGRIVGRIFFIVIFKRGTECSCYAPRVCQECRSRTRALLSSHPALFVKRRDICGI